MNGKDTLKQWNKPTPTYLSKQWSVRLTEDHAALINALVEFYPYRSKTELITDILELGLKEILDAMPTDDALTENEIREDCGQTSPASEYGLESNKVAYPSTSEKFRETLEKHKAEITQQETKSK